MVSVARPITADGSGGNVKFSRYNRMHSVLAISICTVTTSFIEVPHKMLYIQKSGQLGSIASQIPQTVLKIVAIAVISS